MRSMIITRYSFGFYASKVIVLLNSITCIGVGLMVHVQVTYNANSFKWIVINTVAGGGILYDAADGKLPLVVAIILVLVVYVQDSHPPHSKHPFNNMYSKLTSQLSYHLFPRIQSNPFLRSLWLALPDCYCHYSMRNGRFTLC
jgi:hypothetical protein